MNVTGKMDALTRVNAIKIETLARSLKEVDGIKVEGNYAAHQVPLPNAKTDENQLKMLEKWLQSYNFKELYHEFAFED